MKCKTILVVDDEPDVLETIVEVLERHQIQTAGTFGKALELLETQRYDMAILDVMGVKGLDLLATAVRKEIPAVMLTAPAMNPEYILKSMELGAVSYISKEDLAHLDALLAELLGVLERGESPWRHTMERLEPTLDERLPVGWKDEYKKLWD
ncbi:MAG: response regulator [Desulfomonile tiedjei]|uniref:Response regulator n=1 Tax=Desulfomonile tiedjei TaxID=2358 RepID=A0A9D6V1L2_9BACT|nr:response regulator [Desulfomonile tiedjei]